MSEKLLPCACRENECSSDLAPGFECRKQRNKIENAARVHCAKLLTSSAARALPQPMAEALVTIAFSYGAAWALDVPGIIDLGDAQLDSIRNAGQ